MGVVALRKKIKSYLRFRDVKNSMGICDGCMYKSLKFILELMDDKEVKGSK